MNDDAAGQESDEEYEARVNRERPSRVREVAVGPAWWTTVDLFVGNNIERMVVPIRSTLECMRIGVNYWQIPNPHVADRVRADGASASPYVIVAMHGDGSTLTYAGSEPAWGAEEIRAASCFAGRTVISIGCMSGHASLVEAFFDSGAVAYLAPTAMPYGHAAPTFISTLFFLLTQNHSLPEALATVTSLDYELSHWQLFEAPA